MNTIHKKYNTHIEFVKSYNWIFFEGGESGYSDVRT